MLEGIDMRHSSEWYAVEVEEKQNFLESFANLISDFSDDKNKEIESNKLKNWVIFESFKEILVSLKKFNPTCMNFPLKRSTVSLTNEISSPKIYETPNTSGFEF